MRLFTILAYLLPHHHGRKLDSGLSISRVTRLSDGSYLSEIVR